MPLNYAGKEKMTRLTVKDYKRLLDLINIIYSVRDRNAMLRAVCEGLEPLVPISSGVFIGLNLDEINKPAPVNQDLHYLHHVGSTELKSYADYYVFQDPFYLLGSGCWNHARNQAKTYSDYIPLKRLKETEYARDFLSRVPMFDCMGAVLGVHGHTVGVLGLHRQARDSNFNARDKEVVNRLLPHLARALLDGHHAQPTMGVILLDEKGCPVYMDEVAARVTRERSLKELLEAATTKQALCTRAGSYSVNSVQLRGGKEVMLFLNGLEDTVPIRSTLAAFNLTPRQQEIAHYVLQGLSNQEIAERLFISQQTVKDHLHDTYKKMQVSNRCALAAKVLGR